MWFVNKFQVEYNQLSENPLSLPRTANSSCELTFRLLLQDELFSSYWRLHRFINMVTTTALYILCMGCRLCQNSEFYELELKCRYLWNWLVLWPYSYVHTGIYTWYWYLRTILVFTNDTGIYAPYWYLRVILVFMHSTIVHSN